MCIMVNKSAYFRIKFVLHAVYAPAMWNYSDPVIHCERGNDLSSDPEAIVSMWVQHFHFRAHVNMTQ